MFCSKCGIQLKSGEKFCSHCGYLIENNDQEVEQKIFENNNIKSGNINSSANAVNPNMKKWAVLSIVIPIVSIIWYWYIGLSIYMAMLFAAIGLNFSKKGELADKKLSNIGRICNYILIVITILMFIINLTMYFLNKNS